MLCTKTVIWKQFREEIYNHLEKQNTCFLDFFNMQWIGSCPATKFALILQLNKRFPCKTSPLGDEDTLWRAWGQTSIWSFTACTGMFQFMLQVELNCLRNVLTSIERENRNLQQLLSGDPCVLASLTVKWKHSTRGSEIAINQQSVGYRDFGSSDFSGGMKTL